MARVPRDSYETQGSRTMSYRRAPRLVLVASLAGGVVSCADRTIVDDFGPPAGFATISGAVFHGSQPVSNVPVAVSGCEEPIGGLAATSQTDAAGMFSADAALPPAGAVSFPDTLPFLPVLCRFFVSQELALDSLVVPFYRSREAVAPVRVTIKQ